MSPIAAGGTRVCYHRLSLGLTDRRAVVYRGFRFPISECLDTAFNNRVIEQVQHE